MKSLKLFIPVFISIFLILSDYKFSYLDNFRSHAATLISPIYFLVNLPSQLYSWIDEQGTEKDILLSQNKQLNREILELKTTLQKYNNLLLENTKLSKLLGSSYSINKEKFTLAKITSISQSRLKKQLVINKGSNDGINKGQAAFGPDGVIGQVIHATPLYSTIITISDPTHSIPVKNQRNGVRGIAKGKASKSNQIIVNFIESNQDIVEGDVFVSSALGSKFPQGYPVGRVISVKTHKEDPMMDIFLVPIQSTNEIEYLLVLPQENED
jgi:rod shape-determining protein MreC